MLLSRHISTEINVIIKEEAQIWLVICLVWVDRIFIKITLWIEELMSISLIYDTLWPKKISSATKLICNLVRSGCKILVSNNPKLFCSFVSCNRIQTFKYWDISLPWSTRLVNTLCINLPGLILTGSRPIEPWQNQVYWLLTCLTCVKIYFIQLKFTHFDRINCL